MKKISTEEAFRMLRIDGGEKAIRDHALQDMKALGLQLPRAQSPEYGRGFADTLGAIAKNFAQNGRYEKIAAQAGQRPISINLLQDYKVFTYPYLLHFNRAVAEISRKRREKYKEEHPAKDIRELDSKDMERYLPRVQKQILIARAILSTTDVFKQAPAPSPAAPTWDAAAKENLMRDLGTLADTDEPLRHKLIGLRQLHAKKAAPGGSGE